MPAGSICLLALLAWAWILGEGLALIAVSSCVLLYVAFTFKLVSMTVNY